jgi:hypothetical protein
MKLKVFVRLILTSIRRYFAKRAVYNNINTTQDSYAYDYCYDTYLDGIIPQFGHIFRDLLYNTIQKQHSYISIKSTTKIKCKVSIIVLQG